MESDKINNLFNGKKITNLILLKASGLLLFFAILFVGCSDTTPTTPEVLVPNLLGLSQSDALNMIEQLRLQPGTISEQIDESVSAGLIIGQFPDPGTTVEIGYPVSLIIAVADNQENGILTLEIINELEEMATLQNWTFNVGLNGVSDVPMETLCGFYDPEYRPYSPKIDGVGLDEEDYLKADFPVSFDWRAQNGITSIKNQGSCGSCWAFATVGAVESLIKIAERRETDISEQWLVSNNTDGWGCGGGYFSFDYFVNKRDQ